MRLAGNVNQPILIFVSLLLLHTSDLIRADSYPTHHPVPGGIAVIRLELPDAAAPDARFGRKQIMALRNGTGWSVVVGIDLDTPLGNYLITASTPAGTTVTREFSVTPHNYPFRSGKHSGLIPGGVKVPDDWTPELRASFPLSRPVDTTNIVEFGTRYSDGEEIVRIRGVTLKPSQNAEVRTPGAGIVAEVVEVEADGTYVVVQHGMGLYSYLGPLFAPRVAVDQELADGDVLGDYEIKESGPRALNWQVTLNGVMINPLLFVRRPE